MFYNYYYYSCNVLPHLMSGNHPISAPAIDDLPGHHCNFLKKLCKDGYLGKQFEYIYIVIL